MPLPIETRSARATQHAAERFARTLRPGDIVGLTGPLGAGKTCFARGVIAALAGDPEQFQGSPSFALVQEYATPLATVCHFDFYRIKHAGELDALGWEDYCTPDRICLVEWADRFPELLPLHTQWLAFELLGPHTRRIAAVPVNP